MSNDPFCGNKNFKQLFSIRSDQSYCDPWERTELYQHVKEGYYVLWRYQVDNASNIMPRRVLLKFTELLTTEVEDSGTRTTLFLTTGYKDLNTITQRVNICCGSRPYVLQVEKKLYEFLL